jgi:hypothetical protein
MATDVGWRRTTTRVSSAVLHICMKSHFLLRTTVRTRCQIRVIEAFPITLLTRNVAALATPGPNSSAMISRVMHCVLASIPLLTKIRRGSLSKFNTGFSAAKFDLDDTNTLVTPHSLTLHGHAPDAFGGDGK